MYFESGIQETQASHLCITCRREKINQFDQTETQYTY